MEKTITTRKESKQMIKKQNCTLSLSHKGWKSTMWKIKETT